MVVEWFLLALSALVRGMLALFPTVPVPGWLSNAPGYLSSLVESAASLGTWIPWSLTITVTAVVLGCLVIGFAVKAVRIVLSFLTAGGGSAA